MHRVLARQLRRLQIAEDAAPTPTQWRELLAYVEHTYVEADQGRYLLERANDLSSIEMQQLHEKLASERDRLRALIGCLGDALVVLDREGRIQLANEEAVRLIGRTQAELAGRALADVVTCREADPSSLVDCVRRGACRNEDATFVDGRGRLVEVAVTVNPVVHDGAPQGATVVFRDTTAKRQMDAALRHAQRLESVGRLAAGIAHEINTPIQFVNDNVHFMKESFDALLGLAEETHAILAVDDAAERAARLEQAQESADWGFLRDEIPRSVEQTLEGLKRVAAIVQSMKSFAHDDRGQRQPTDLNAELQHTLTVAGHELKGVAIATATLGDIPPVTCIRGDINQVILNLIVNAAHAVADVVAATGALGRIDLVTRRDGEDVVISVSDTGSGIPESIQPHLFDPFFTTKDVGRGSGQGLSLARNIVVQKHGGNLTFVTEVGVGTTFFMRLPIAGRAKSGAELT